MKNELYQALTLEKLIRPVLLEGEAWLSLKSRHYFHGRATDLPPDAFFESVAADLGVDLKTATPIKEGSVGLTDVSDAILPGGNIRGFLPGTPSVL